MGGITWNNAPTAAEKLEADRAKKMAEINGGYNAFLGSLVSDYPTREAETFVKQEKEAEAWLTDNTSSTPFIDGMLETRAISKAELVGKIIAKAEAIAPMTGRATGYRQTLEAAALDAKTEAELAAIVVDYSTLLGQTGVATS